MIGVEEGDLVVYGKGFWVNGVVVIDWIFLMSGCRSMVELLLLGWLIMLILLLRLWSVWWVMVRFMLMLMVFLVFIKGLNMVL